MTDLKLLKKHKDILLALHNNALANPATPFLFYKPSDKAVSELATAVYLYGDPSRANDKGEVPFILSPTGIPKAAELATKTSEPSAPRVQVPATAITLFEVDDWTPPEKGRGGRQGSVYPFDQVEMGANGKTTGFFVAVTTERPEPWKSLIGTVNAYNKKMKDAAPEGTTPRQFAKPERRKHPTQGEGAFVARIS